MTTTAEPTEAPAPVPPPAEPALPPVEPEPAPIEEKPAPAAPAAVAGVGTFRRWIMSEPVRLHAYVVLTAIGALLVYRGVIREVEMEYWVKVVSALLFGTVSTEHLRNAVWSPASHDAVTAP